MDRSDRSDRYTCECNTQYARQMGIGHWVLVRKAMRLCLPKFTTMPFFIASLDGFAPIENINPINLKSTNHYMLDLPPLEAYSGESATKNRMARRIQNRWRECCSNPQFLICRKRLEREFQTDCEPPTYYSGPSASYDCFRLQNWLAEGHMLGEVSNENRVQNAFCDVSEISERFARELELRFPGRPKTLKESKFRS